jgi:bifunctional non-homologous end joining protein LigD
MPVRHYGQLSVETSREDKPLFGSGGISKGQLIDYYEQVWDRMRPHLVDRPLVMQRFPDGIEHEGFYQKQVGDYFPDWIDRVRVPVRQDGSQTLVVCNAKATLAYLANQACVTPHLWLSRSDALEQPDQLVVDLDPPGRDFAPVRRAALQCRELLDELELHSVVKTTGSRGVHVIVPLRAEESFDAVREFAKQMALALARRHPRALTVEQRKAKRDGRLYLDVGRNAYAQTAVSPYGVRALEGAPVAMPLDWSELSDGGLDARSFDVGSISTRLEAADPWSGWRRRARGLDPARRRIDQILADDG